MNKKTSKIILILIIITAFLLRFIKLNEYPPSLNWDEISHGYNAYSVLETSKDEWGTKLPLIFRAYGDYKLPLYIYGSIPLIAFLGLNPISVRLLSVFSGTFLVFIIYLIVKKITPKNKYIPLIAASLIAFSPITIFLSRIALEANLWLTLFFLSIYFLISKKYSLSSLFYALGLLSYNSSRVILPFYLLLLIILMIKDKYKFFKNKNYLKFTPLLIVLLIVAWQMLDQSGQARYQWVSLLDQGSINRINELRQVYPRFLVNKATFFLFYAAKNYLSHFNPSYLFFKGGSHYQFNIPNFYFFSPFLIPFLLLGIINLFRKIKDKNIILILLFCLLISPIPSAITRDAPHVLRSITFLPTIAILISLAFISLNKKLSKIIFFVLLAILLLGQKVFWDQYKNYSIEYSSSWQYGYRQTIDFIQENYNQYDQIIFTKKYGEAHEFILFYWPWEALDYQDKEKDWDYHATWYWVNSFDKFTFINDWEIKEKTQDLDSKTLLITSPDNYNEDNTKLIKTINFLNQEPAFQILEIN